jgi:cytochrome c556
MAVDLQQGNQANIESDEERQSLASPDIWHRMENFVENLLW